MTNRCPLCEFSTDVDVDLESHMLTHSKESLINYLLHRKPARTSAKVASGSSRMSIHSVATSQLSQTEPCAIAPCAENQCKTETVEAESTGQTTKSRHQVGLQAASSTSVIHERKRRTSTEHRAVSVPTNGTTRGESLRETDKVYTIQINVEDQARRTTSVDLVSPKTEGPNVDSNPSSSSTSVKSRRHAPCTRKQFLFLDGKLIPVSTPADSVPSEANNAATSRGTDGDSQSYAASECISAQSGGTNVDVDLMTDEEIPPKGEISEYEESSTSLMSDDINADYEESVDPLELQECVNRKVVAQRSSPVLGCDEAIVRSADTSTLGDDNGSANTASKNSTEFVSIFQLIKQEQDHEFKVPPTPSRRSRGTRAFYCIYCNFTNTVKASVDDHIRLVHPGKSTKPDKFECSICGKLFDSRAKHTKHMLVHKSKLYNCTTCRKAFPSNSKLQVHIRIHEGVYPFQCTLCGNSYRTITLLRTHEKRNHPKPEDPPYAPRRMELVCPVCQKVIRSKRNMDAHMVLHEQKPVKCTYCSESFARRSVFIRHVRVCHDPTFDSLKTKQCRVCGKSLHPNSLKSHLLIHAEEKPYKCLVCHKDFRTAGNLKNHAWSHTSVDRPCKCHLCPKSYIFNKNLQNHLMVHKKKTFHFVCNECGVKFTNKNNLKRHVEEHSGEKKYECSHCDKKFFRQYYLVEHERIHSGLRPFTCNICGKASATKSNHLSHIKVHDVRESGNLEG